MSCLRRDSGGGRVRQDTDMALYCYLARLFHHMYGEGNMHLGTAAQQEGVFPLPPAPGSFRGQTDHGLNLRSCIHGGFGLVLTTQGD